MHCAVILNHPVGKWSNASHTSLITTIKAALSIWTGLFLILPNCLCQVLACFGIMLHDQGPEDKGGVAIVLLAASHLGLGDRCHCDDETGQKTAEPCEEDAPFNASEVDEKLVKFSIETPSLIVSLRAGASRAPPDTWHRFLRNRRHTVLCVWQV